MRTRLPRNRSTLSNRTEPAHRMKSANRCWPHEIEIQNRLVSGGRNDRPKLSTNRRSVAPDTFRAADAGCRMQARLRLDFESACSAAILRFRQVQQRLLLQAIHERPQSLQDLRQ